MRLINTHTLELEEPTYKDMSFQYAILSHTWGADEVTFQQYSSGHETVRDKEGYRKIAWTCSQALEDGIDYAWVDTG